MQHSLSEFAAKSLGDPLRRGRREREAISLYVFRYLLREISPGRFLRDAAQIGIEYPVPQIVSHEASRASGRLIRKTQVCKDVAIWAKPGVT